MKKIMMILLSVVLVFGLVGCSNKIDTSKFVPSEVLEKIQTDFELPISTPGTEAEITDIYQLKLEDIEEYAIARPMMISATEVAIFRVKDVAKAEEVKTALIAYGEATEKSWSQYLPDQYEISKNRTVEVQGDIVYLVIAEEKDKIVTAINEAIGVK